MKIRYLASIFFALLLLSATSLPVLACHMPPANNNRVVAVQNVEMSYTDRDRGVELICHRIDPENANSQLYCQPVAYHAPAVSMNEANAGGFDFANLIWMVLIIAIHFVFGLFHTWFREKKKDK